jgi:hypothetical protein
MIETVQSRKKKSLSFPVNKNLFSFALIDKLFIEADFSEKSKSSFFNQTYFYQKNIGWFNSIEIIERK